MCDRHCFVIVSLSPVIGLNRFELTAKVLSIPSKNKSFEYKSTNGHKARRVNIIVYSIRRVRRRVTNDGLAEGCDIKAIDNGFEGSGDDALQSLPTQFQTNKDRDSDNGNGFEGSGERRGGDNALQSLPSLTQIQTNKDRDIELSDNAFERSGDDVHFQTNERLNKGRDIKARLVCAVNVTSLVKYRNELYNFIKKSLGDTIMTKTLQHNGEHIKSCIINVYGENKKKKGESKKKIVRFILQEFLRKKHLNRTVQINRRGNRFSFCVGYDPKTVRHNTTATEGAGGKKYTIDCSAISHYQQKDLFPMKRFFANHARLINQGGGDISIVVSSSLLVVIHCAKPVTMKMLKTILFHFKKKQRDLLAYKISSKDGVISFIHR